MKKFLSVLLVVVMVFALCSTAFAEGEYDGKVVILHSNDVHGSIAGYAKMAAIKADFVAKGAEVILADAGDFSQGTCYVSTTKGAEAVNMMNAVGYDVATLGNHEFDYGWAQLKENMSKASFKVLCADVSENGKTIFDANTIIEKGGVKIGFFGMETPEAQTKVNPALIKGLDFVAGEKLYACAQAQVDALKAAGADVVICLSHLGLDGESAPNRSSDMLANVTGIDMVIDGHSHTRIAATAGSPIQSTGTAFESVGVIVIDKTKKTIEDNSLFSITHTEADPADPSSTITVTDYEKEDATVKGVADGIISRIDAEYAVKFAESKVALEGTKAIVRSQETNLGDLIADSMVWAATKEEGSIKVPAENVVAITNGGGIRASIGIGDITKKDVNTVLPFGNTVAVIYVSGAELLEALEASTYCTPDSVGAFPQVAGVEFVLHTGNAWDPNPDTYPDSTYYGPASINRVSIVSVNGQPFDVDETYAIVSNNFCAAGGDTYYAFAAATEQFDTGIPLDEALMAYITDVLGGVVGEQYAEPQGRITICDGCDEDFEEVTVDPTCTEDGYVLAVCPKCELVTVVDVIPAPGHDFKDGVCTVCGAEDPDFEDVDDDDDVDPVDPPQTGDNSHVALFVVLSLVAVSGLALTKKREEN